MGRPGSSCSHALAMCSFQVTLLQVNASCSQRLGNRSFTQALAPRRSGFMPPAVSSGPQSRRGPCHRAHRAEEDDGSGHPWLLGSPAPARRRQGVWERSLSEQGGLAMCGHPRPDRKAASAQSRDRDGLPSSGSRAAPRGHVRGRGRCFARFRTTPKGWEELRALSSQTAPLWLSL